MRLPGRFRQCCYISHFTLGLLQEATKIALLAININRKRPSAFHEEVFSHDTRSPQKSWIQSSSMKYTADIPCRSDNIEFYTNLSFPS